MATLAPAQLHKHGATQTQNSICSSSGYGQAPPPNDAWVLHNHLKHHATARCIPYRSKEALKALMRPSRVDSKMLGCTPEGSVG
eukprot:978862-Lingulodinium_polyedra.AAC.1